MLNKLSLKTCVGLSVALAGCSSTASPAETPSIKWIADQYFGGRNKINIPDMKNRPEVDVGILSSFAPDEPRNLKDGDSNPEVIVNYFFPTQRFRTSSSFGRYYAREDTSAMIEDKILRYKGFPKGVDYRNYLNVNAVDDDAIVPLKEKISQIGGTVVFASKGCVVAEPYRQDSKRRYIEVFVAGHQGRWGLRDPIAERCVLAGILGVIGADVAWVMPRVDRYYPRAVSSAYKGECLFAVAYRGARALEERNIKPSSYCVTRAVGAWSYRLLWSAFERGALRRGPVTRAQFVKALSGVEALLGDEVRRGVLRDESAVLDYALRDD